MKQNREDAKLTFPKSPYFINQKKIQGKIPNTVFILEVSCKNLLFLT